MKSIQWNKVTWYSKLLAVIIFVGVFVWAFYLGKQYGLIYAAQNVSSTSAAALESAVIPITDLITEKILNKVLYSCDVGKTFHAEFMQNNIGQESVALELSDGRKFIFPQTLSADGGRYAQPNGSVVFWSKGNGAFIQEGAPYSNASDLKMTYENCVAGPAAN